MTVRTVDTSMRSMRTIGWAAPKAVSDYKERTLAAAVKKIASLVVFPDPLRFMQAVGLRIDTEGKGKPVFLALAPAAALEIVKGVLQNLDAMYVAADDELVAIFKEKMAEADREVKAAVEAVRRPLAPMPGYAEAPKDK